MKSVLVLIILVSGIPIQSSQLLPCPEFKGSMAEFEKKVIPAYPTTPYANGITKGEVQLMVYIDSNGDAINTIVKKANPPRYFVRSAQMAAKKSRYIKSSDKQRCSLVTYRYKINK